MSAKRSLCKGLAQPRDASLLRTVLPKELSCIKLGDKRGEKSLYTEVSTMWQRQTIGETAGDVWQFLQSNGRSRLSAVERGIEAPKALVDMAVGWLACERKLELSQEKRAIQVWLTEG
jgi:hypothetical protein